MEQGSEDGIQICTPDELISNNLYKVVALGNCIQGRLLFMILLLPGLISGVIDVENLEIEYDN